MAPRKKKLPPIQVLIPYDSLQELLTASEMVESLVEDNQSLRNQMGALRLQFTELMERLREIQD